MSHNDTIEVAVEIMGETDKALLVSDTGDRDDAVWIPKSQIEYPDGSKRGDTVTIEMPEWLAEDKGLI